MKLVQRLFMGFGGLAAAAALLTLFSPKAHALVATLVEVVNTRSTPVPNQDVDHPARHPYQQICFNNTIQGGDLSCQTPAAPPNTEVVIQNVSMIVSSNVAPQVSRIITVGGGVSINTYIPLVAQTGNYMVSQQLTQYVDPGTSATCDTQLNSTNAQLICTITGYTVSLP
jgi:hypothetical protein